MSYMQFRQQCSDCLKIWNAAFGIVGVTRIAEPPHECPFCKSKNIVHYAHGWLMDNGEIFPKQEPT